MTRQEYIDYCISCSKKSFNRDKGLVCSLTNDIPSFNKNCSDFKKDENYDDKQKHNQSNINLTLPLLLGIFAIIGISVIIYYTSDSSSINIIAETTEHAEKKEDDFYTYFNEDDCLDFAYAIEYSAINNDPLFINKVIDYDYLVDYMTLNKKINDLSKTNLKQILKSTSKPGSQLIKQIIPGGHFSFQKYYRKNNTPHLIFRAFRKGVIIILDLELGILRNQIGIKNAYNYSLGETWGDLYFTRLSVISKYKKKPYALQEAVNNMNQITSLINEQNYEEADSIYQLLPQDFTKLKQAEMLALQITAKTNPESYSKTIEHIINIKKKNKRHVALLKMNKYSSEFNYQETLKAVNELNEYLNSDDILIYFLAKSCLDTNNIELAQKYTTEFTEIYSNLIDGHLIQLEIYLTQNNVKEAIGTLRYIFYNFDVSKEDLDSFLNSYENFKKSNEYQQFINKL